MKKVSLIALMVISGITMISTGCQRKNSSADVKPATGHSKHEGHDHSSHSTDDGHGH
jgi:L-asparagine transporter-like permease